MGQPEMHTFSYDEYDIDNNLMYTYISLFISLTEFQLSHFRTSSLLFSTFP